MKDLEDIFYVESILGTKRTEIHFRILFRMHLKVSNQFYYQSFRVGHLSAVGLHDRALDTTSQRVDSQAACTDPANRVLALDPDLVEKKPRIRLLRKNRTRMKNSGPKIFLRGLL